MRLALAALLALSIPTFPACTSLQPTEAQPEEIRRLILTGNLLEPGDRVRVVTSDGTEYRFRVSAIDPDTESLIGSNVAVPIADLVAIETREVSLGRTALLTGGVIGLGVIIAIAIAPTVILSGG